jgi:hypothetical protein
MGERAEDLEHVDFHVDVGHTLQASRAAAGRARSESARVSLGRQGEGPSTGVVCARRVAPLCLGFPQSALRVGRGQPPCPPTPQATAHAVTLYDGDTVCRPEGETRECGHSALPSAPWGDHGGRAAGRERTWLRLA